MVLVREAEMVITIVIASVVDPSRNAFSIRRLSAINLDPTAVCVCSLSVMERQVLSRREERGCLCTSSSTAVLAAAQLSYSSRLMLFLFSFFSPLFWSMLGHTTLFAVLLWTSFVRTSLRTNYVLYHCLSSLPPSFLDSGRNGTAFVPFCIIPRVVQYKL